MNPREVTERVHSFNNGRRDRAGDEEVRSFCIEGYDIQDFFTNIPREFLQFLRGSVEGVRVTHPDVNFF